MYAQVFTLFENEAVATEVEVEEIELRDLPADPRLQGMSEHTRFVVVTQYGADVDEAVYQASHMINLFRRPPAWCLELVGAVRTGWKDWSRLTK